MAKKFYGGIDIQTNSKLRLFESAGANFASLRSAASMAADIEFILPATDVASGVLQSNGSGTLSIALLLNANVGAAAAIALTKLAATTASRALASDASGFIVPSATTDTELGFVSGVTSAIQTQINAKASLSGATFTGDVYLDNEKLLKLGEADAGGTEFIALKAPAAITTSVTYTLPEAPATSGFVLASTTGGAMSWVSNASTSSFKDTWTTAQTATKAITHNLATTDVNVQIFDIATGADIDIDSVVRTDANTVTVTASEAPPAGSWRVLIVAV